MFIEFLDRQFDLLSETLDLPSDQAKLVTCLLISYPVGLAFKSLRNAFARNLFGLCLGLFYQYLCFREQIIHPLIMALFTYFAMKFLGRNRAVWIMVLDIAYLSFIHIKRMYEAWGAWNLEITTILMIFVCKCTTFAWSYHDGGRQIETLTQDQKKKRIEKLPSLFQYLSYMYFYATSLVGPCYDYSDHEQFINMEGDYAKSDRSFLPSLGYLMCGLLQMAIVVVFQNVFSSEYTWTSDYFQRSWMSKFIYLSLVMRVVRSKYYTAWLIATANVTASGLNYNAQGKTFWEKYGRIVSVKPLEFELKDNIRDKLEAWNCPTQIWLKNCVYSRIVSEEEARKNPSKATFASNITFMVSAFWHGFYPLYYATFFIMFLAQQINKSLFKIRHKLRWIPEPIGYAIRWTLANFAFDFAGNAFVLLEHHKGYEFFKAWRFIPNLVLLALFLFFTFSGFGKTPKGKTPSRNEAVSNNAAEKLQKSE